MKPDCVSPRANITATCRCCKWHLRPTAIVPILPSQRLHHLHKHIVVTEIFTWHYICPVRDVDAAMGAHIYRPASNSEFTKSARTRRFRSVFRHGEIPHASRSGDDPNAPPPFCVPIFHRPGDTLFHILPCYDHSCPYRTPMSSPGMSMIDYEITYPNNPRFVFQDSRGIEAGGGHDLSKLRVEYIQKFINQ